MEESSGEERGDMRKEKWNTEVVAASRPPPLHRCLSSASSVGEEVRLAAAAVGLKVRPRSSDMPPAMQERAFRCTRALIGSTPARRLNLTLLAMALKKEFDRWYGPAWHCVAGRSFGSFLTHSAGGFVYFSLLDDNGDEGDEEEEEEEEEEGGRNDPSSHLSFLLFQTRIHRI